MASQYESGDGWTITRLRTYDAAYLGATYRTARPLPPPIALATGPNGQTNAGQIGASEVWALDTTLPAVDCCWVVVQADPILQNTGATYTAGYWWFPQGNNSIGTALTPPALGPGDDLSPRVQTANGGSFQYTDIPGIPRGGRSMWLPLDPDNTLAGVATQFVALNGGAAANAGTYSVNLTHCRMLAYPVSAWATGALWEPLADRGT